MTRGFHAVGGPPSAFGNLDLFQITVIGRYGSTNARAKIPLGFYYGHTYILPWESDLKLINSPLRRENGAASQPDVDQHLTMMVALQEDIQCRYS